MSTPTTPQTTYFGDVNVYGNTTMSGTLAVLGTPALFYSNLGGTSLIGTQAIPFQYAWTTAANTTSVNFLTNIPGPIGVATTDSGATVTIQGNVQVSNSVSTTNINVTTSINTGSVMNVNFVTGPGGVGIGTNVVGSAALAVLGTMNSVSSFQAANLILSGTLNVTSANIFSIVTSNIGIGAPPVTGGATLVVQGFASVSNAITTTNVYVTTANVARLNTAALVNSSGFFGFGTAVASGTTAYVQGDLGSSNAINAPVMTSNGLIATGRINVATIVARSNVGVGIAPVQGGPALAVSGNVFLSNAFTTPQVFADFMNVSNRSNIVTGVATSNVLIGPAADMYRGFNLAVDGNVIISNALQTAGVTANLINVGSSANLLALMNAFAIGTNTLFPGAFITINGNMYVSNSLTGSNVTTTRSNAAITTNVSITLTAMSNVGIGTTPAAGGPSLVVQGNAFISNALETTNVFATTSANVLTLNTGSIFTTSTGFLGIGRANPSGTTLYVPGNVYASNALTTTTISVTNSNILASNATTIYVSSNVGIGTTPVTGGANLAVLGNAFISNDVTTTNVYATTSANVLTLNTGSIFTTGTRFLGVGTAAPSGTTLYVSGNVYASNALSTTNVRATTMNVTGRANTTNFTMATGQFLGIGTTPTGNALEVSGNAFVSNAIRSTNVFSTLANLGTLNTLSIFTRNSFLGVGTSAASGTSLFVSGNVYASASTNTPAMFTPAADVALRGNALSVTSGTAFVVPTRFVAVADSTTAAAYSNDGITWVASTMPSASNWRSVTVNPTTGRFVAVADSTTAAAYSNDGINWVASTMPAASNWRSVIVNPTTGRFVAVATGNGAAAYSNDGINWVASTMPSASNWRSVIVYYSMGSPSLSLLGNLFASNAVTTTNITATSANVTGVSNVTSLAQIPALSLGTSAIGPGIGVRGNVVASNSVTTTNVYGTTSVNTSTLNTTSIFGVAGFVGVGAGPSGTALYVQGNLYASNALTIVGNIAGTSMNLTSTLNTDSFTTAIIVVGELGWSNTNIYISNSITTTNVFTTNVNAASYVGTSGSIGINTSASGYALQINGNLALSNTLSSLPGVSALTSIYYVDDITKRSPHLLPTPSNATLIQNWISTTCNAASQPTKAWWSTSSLPIYANAASGPSGPYAYAGSVLVPDGRVIFVPHVATGIGIYTPETGLYSNVTPSGFPGGDFKFQGGVLTPNGNVVFIPCTAAAMGVFNPVNLEFTFAPSVPTGGGDFYRGGVLAPNGNVVMIPSGSTSIGQFNPTTGVYSAMLAHGTGGLAYRNGVLLPNGNVVMIPYTTTFIGQYNPILNTFTKTSFRFIVSQSFNGGVLAPNGNVVMVPSVAANVCVFNPSASTLSNVGPIGENIFCGGALLPTGNIIFFPTGTSNIGMFDPIALTYSNSTFTGIGDGPDRVCGGSLLPSGQVVLSPYTLSNVGVIDTFTPAPVELCLSPYFNKL